MVSERSLSVSISPRRELLTLPAINLHPLALESSPAGAVSLIAGIRVQPAALATAATKHVPVLELRMADATLIPGRDSGIIPNP